MATLNKERSSRNTTHTSAPTGLADLQDAFQQAILAGDDGILDYLRDSTRTSRDVLLGVYRHAYTARLIEIVAADYPVLHRFIGDEAFDDMARHYIADRPSHQPNASLVSRALPDFLRQTKPYTGYPAVAELAEIECALGVRTSYYVRLHAPWYNPGAVGELQFLTSIHAMGHEIGLHYEPRYFEALGRDVAAGIRGDIAHLEHQLGFKTKSVSQHEPTVGPLVETLPEGYPCAYQRHLVIDMPYFGDSGMKWREGCVCQKLGKLEQLHALIHPANWIRADEPWTEVLRHHAQDAGRRLEMLMEAHVEDQRIYLANRDRLDAERRARY